MDSTDPNRYTDAEYRKKAHRSATFLGEPAATELRAAITTIDGLMDEDAGDSMRYAIDALLSELDEWLENPDPAEAYDWVLRIKQELGELL